MVARPPFENLLFYAFKPIKHSGLSKVLYKIQQIKPIEEALGRVVNIN